MGTVSRQRPRVRGRVATWKYFMSPFWKNKKYLHDMDLTLTEHVRNTISLLYKQKTGQNSDFCKFFSEKINFGHFGLHFAENKHFQVGHVLITPLWRHTLTDFHDFGIKDKTLPYIWYQTTIILACQFQNHRGW